MSAKEKSDLPEVAEKRANKAASAAAELVERTGGAKENAELQSTVRTQSREAVSRAQARIREAVIRNNGLRQKNRVTFGPAGTTRRRS
jgi:RNA-directed DNA polymerase